MDSFLEPIATTADTVVFYSVPVGNGHSVPVVLVLLAATALFLTIYFKFLNLRSLGLAVRTVRGKYSKDDDPGQITHFQALATALSATVGLGNIAGVAVAIGIGGPGAVFWMVVMGFLGMSSKFTECTLGVRYRKIDPDGTVHGGGMRYLQQGLAERGFSGLGKVLAILFAVACVGGALGAGNMFQMNQSAQQVVETFGIFGGGQEWILGILVAVAVGAVILGGIVSIARVTAFLVPFMTIIYVIACIVVLVGYMGEIPAALGTIFGEAFSPEAGLGGFIGGLIQGIKRGVFSNEAGLGSAAIAHAPVKTRKPASEGVVALLEPFIDTVIICLMTALVIVVTGVWKADASLATAAPIYQQADAQSEVLTTLTAGELVKVEKSIAEVDKAGDSWVPVHTPDGDASGFIAREAVVDRTGWSGGIWLTSRSFGSVISWFPYVLTVAVVLFAFSTMISWSYYGEQAIGYLTGYNQRAVLVYKVVFCLCVVLGAGASLQNVLKLSDAMYFAMVAPNLIGLYFLLPIVKKELADFQDFAKRVDAGASLDEAEDAQ
ncbi:amino acid carrier protein [Roseibacillus ishigakijimensis]|uniref:Amino acid carrier protein n=1 Tax=Roseibacillus ishigakijimensis TaxID=454146 RepID=A0A934RRV2_9BACT|nr:amino acid carrier protein [Roseibacillus ishigakijimensis]MBK1834313.1 amino acid carrier protein [Roseibacillus ishigakijimensis]